MDDGGICFADVLELASPLHCRECPPFPDPPDPPPTAEPPTIITPTQILPSEYPKQTPDDTDYTPVIISVSVCLVLLAVIAFLVWYCRRRRYCLKKPEEDLLKENENKGQDINLAKTTFENETSGKGNEQLNGTANESGAGTSRPEDEKAQNSTLSVESAKLETEKQNKKQGSTVTSTGSDTVSQGKSEKGNKEGLNSSSIAAKKQPAKESDASKSRPEDEKKQNLTHSVESEKGKLEKQNLTQGSTMTSTESDTVSQGKGEKGNEEGINNSSIAAKEQSTKESDAGKSRPEDEKKQNLTHSVESEKLETEKQNNKQGSTVTSTESDTVSQGKSEKGNKEGLNSSSIAAKKQPAKESDASKSRPEDEKKQNLTHSVESEKGKLEKQNLTQGSTMTSTESDTVSQGKGEKGNEGGLNSSSIAAKEQSTKESDAGKSRPEDEKKQNLTHSVESEKGKLEKQNNKQESTAISTESDTVSQGESEKGNEAGINSSSSSAKEQSTDGNDTNADKTDHVAADKTNPSNVTEADKSNSAKDGADKEVEQDEQDEGFVSAAQPKADNVKEASVKKMGSEAIQTKV
ncbi:cylicin-2-like [Ptychodera flava]|uniref:cylicin-2-like n=1 Tax=Ptychodera flava TaxID=63121 RepID=UPI00396A178C